MAEMEIRAEYTGVDPDIKPAAHAFARMIKNAVNADGAFADPELEAEFQEWLKAKTKPAGVGAPTGLRKG